MRVDVFLPEVEFEDAAVFRLALNRTCTIKVVDEERPLRWFAEHDPVLRIDVSSDGKSAEVTSTAAGKSEIWFFTRTGNNDVQVKKLFIEVFDRNEAASFKIATELVPK